MPIEGGGDIVVGQEYTDFDKGLDDGVEGAVFGFNFVLSSTSDEPAKLPGYPLKRQDVKYLNVPNFDVASHFIKQGKILAKNQFPSRRRFARSIFQEMMDLFHAETSSSFPGGKLYSEVPAHRHRVVNRRISNEIFDSTKSLGSLLVELSYDCALRKGAPLNGKGVLINWTKSPVRVFGGAILRKVPPFCRIR